MFTGIFKKKKNIKILEKTLFIYFFSIGIYRDLKVPTACFASIYLFIRPIDVSNEVVTTWKKFKTVGQLLYNC